jgi:F-box domain
MSFNLCQYSNEWSKSLLNLNLFTDEKLKQGRSLAKLALPFIALYQPWQKPIFYGKNLLNVSLRYKNLTMSSNPKDLMKMALSVLEIGTLALGNLRISLMVDTAAELVRSFPKLMNKSQRSPLLMAEAGSKALYLLSLINKQSTPCQIASLVTEGCLSIYRAHLLTKDIQQLTVDANLHTIINNKKGLKGLTQAAMGVIRLYFAYQQKLALTTQTGNQELASFFHQNKQIVIIQNSQSNLQKYILYAGAAALAYRFWEPLAYCLSCLKDFVTGLNSPHLKQMDQNVEEEKEANQTYQEDLGSRQDNTQKFGQTGQRLKKKRAEENQAYEADLSQRMEENQDLIQSTKELEEFQAKQELENRYFVIENEIKRINYKLNQDCLVEEIISFDQVQIFTKQIKDLIQDYQSSNLEDKEAIIETLEEAYGFFDQILEDCASEEESDSSDELEMSSDSDISSGAGSPPPSPIASPILSRFSTFKQEIAQQSQTLTIEQTTSSFTNPSVYKITPLEISKPTATKTLTSSLDQISNPTLVLDIPSPQVIEQIRNNLEDIIEHQASVSDTQTVIIEPKVAVVESSNSTKENTTLSFVKKTSSESSQEKTVQKTTQVFAQKEKANVQEEIDLNLEFLFPSIPSLTPLQTAEKETEKAELELKKIEEVKLREQSTAKSLVQIAKDLLAETAWMTLVFDQELEDQLRLAMDQSNLLLSSLELIPEEKEIKNLNSRIGELRASISNLKEEIKKFNNEIAILEQAKVEKLTPETKLSIADPSTEAKILAKSTKDSKAAVNDLKSQIVDLTSKLNTDTTRLTANLNAKMRLLKKLTHNIEEKTAQLISEKEKLHVVIHKIEDEHLKAFKALSKERIKKPVVVLNILRELAKSTPDASNKLIQSLKSKNDKLYKNYCTLEINRLKQSTFPPELIQNLKQAFLIEELTTTFSTFDPLTYSDTLHHILSYFPSVEQVQIAQVCKNWKREIKDYDYKAKELKQCYLLIKEFRTLIPSLKIESYVRDNLWSQYYRLLANLNLKRAIKEVDQIKGSFWTSADKYQDPALFEIVKVAVLTNLNEARKIANTIKDPYQRTKAYLEIAKVDPSHNIQATEKAFNEIKEGHFQIKIFDEIAKVGALTNLTAAKKMANEHKNSYHKDKIFFEIVKIEALTNIIDAGETANKIQDSYQRFLAFIEIAKVDPAHNLQAAEDAAKKIDSDYSKALAFIEIAKIDPSHNLQAAEDAAKKIDYFFDKTRAFVKIAQVDPLHNLQAAKDAVEKIQKPRKKIKAFIEIIKVEALKNLSQIDKN